MVALPKLLQQETGNNMILPKKLLSDETFHQAFLASYKAIVLIDRYQFTCTILDTTRKKFIYFFTHHSLTPLASTEIEHFFKQHFLSESELKKYIFYATTVVHSIPKSFSKNLTTETKKIILQSKHNNLLETNSLYNVYFIFNPITEYHSFISEQSNIVFLPHIHQLLVQASYNSQKSKHKNTIYIHLHHKHFETICLKDKNPELINIYDYSNEDDVLFYLHAIIQNLSLNIDDTFILFSGHIEKNNSLLKKCKDFYLKHDLINFNNSYIYSYRFNELKAYQYSTLFYLPNENY